MTKWIYRRSYIGTDKNEAHINKRRRLKSSHIGMGYSCRFTFASSWVRNTRKVRKLLRAYRRSWRS